MMMMMMTYRDICNHFGISSIEEQTLTHVTQYDCLAAVLRGMLRKPRTAATFTLVVDCDKSSGQIIEVDKSSRHRCTVMGNFS